ncbi:LacI family transcriptional regulator [Actinotalea fermentans ATCC 43279 = JCM 9966 = DSM 3133]|uniref:LacI family transcriptional regulator n=1 Tax=Actinotalea fermentans TaxID=43671 RepID=A0A511Z211_9CELL|nr:LacI family transcriptional regulator [Actinotalea fermentans ATCC 43279 = JCM 9966 = DSM 3133]GEN81487.1 LacI family transcriptional regulator [Actinotalea fermentans]
MPVTQADVARRAGVSQRTVSNVVNKFPHVSADVVARVTEAIEALGYTPSHAARSLRLGRSGLLQLVVPELDVPYFAELARGVVKCAEERGFGVMVRQTLGDRERERDALEGPAAEHAEGTILSAVGSIEDILATGRGRSPVVLIGERTGMGLVDHIGIDDTAAAAEATRHLVETGRRRVAFIGADPADSLRMAELRLRGYEQALTSAGLPFDETLVVRTRSYHRKDGEEAMAALLALGPDRRPDGVFCATDLLALGALRTARTSGVAVPTELALVGFDGLEEGEYSAPTLSTVAPDKAEIARVAVETLLARIAARAGVEDEPPAQDLLIAFDLVVRESSRAV